MKYLQGVFKTFPPLHAIGGLNDDLLRLLLTLDMHRFVMNIRIIILFRCDDVQIHGRKRHAVYAYIKLNEMCVVIKKINKSNITTWNT